MNKTKRENKTTKTNRDMKKQIFSITLSSMMLLGTCGSAYAAPLSKLPKISDNSLVIGEHLFELDKVNNSQYNLNTFVEAARTAEGNNKGLYYKYNGKWYTGKDIENFNNLKNAKGLDTIPNDITKINGREAKGDFVLDWYQDGDYSHDKDGDNESVEQFVVYFNKAVIQSKGTFKIIVPNNSKPDPYGKDKFGVIECSVDGKGNAKALENVEGGAPVTCFVIHDKGKDKSIPKGYTDRFVLELTEDWTRILNTEKTGYKYEDIKGLKLVAEGFDGEDGSKVEQAVGEGKITAKRNIDLSKDNQKPYIVAHKPIYTKIGENGSQQAGKTRIVFNEPIQLITNKIIEDLKKEGLQQPCMIGSYSNGKYMKYNPITPNQEQLKSDSKGIPVFESEYKKVNQKGEQVLDEKGNPVVIKGIYGLSGDIFDKDGLVEENGDKIKLRLNNLDFKYDFDLNNSGITRFRDYGTIFINPERALPEGNWKLSVKNITDDAGNKMDDYISETFNVEKYFDVTELTKDGMKIKFAKPFTKNDIWGNKIPIVVADSKGKTLVVSWIENIKEGQVDASVTFKKNIENLEGTVYVNSMEYNVNAQSQKSQQSSITADWYQDGDYNHDEDGNDESVGQFQVCFDTPVKSDKGTIKIIVPDKSKKDPYGEGKLGVIEFSPEGKTQAKALKNVEGGAPVECFIVAGETEDESITQGYTKRFTFKLTEDWTRILNTEKTGYNYYDNNFKGLRLVAEGLEGLDGKKIDKVTAKRDINLEKDTQKPYVVLQNPIYTRIGENGFQPAGSTRVVFNEPVQFFTEEMKKEIGNKSGIYKDYKVITPSQEQMKAEGVPTVQAEFYKVDDKGTKLVDKNGKSIMIKGKYAQEGDIEGESFATSKEYDKRISLTLKDINLKCVFDTENSKISRHRDFGMYFIDPEQSLPEGKWKLKIKNVSDKAGNVMDEYVSEIIDIKPYFTIQSLTKDGIKVKFAEPFKKEDRAGDNYIPVMVVDGNKEEIARFYIDDIKDGETEVEVKFDEAIENLSGTVYVNNMVYNVK